MQLYHTGYQRIEKPDVHYGRRNADLGQGFYTTKDREFALRWARLRKDTDTILNTYELDTEGLNIVRFTRDTEWFEYISANRTGRSDRLPDADVVIGPIANDTIFDTFGILTSGLLDEATALRMLQEGPEYEQIVLKTPRAAEHLHWLSAEILDEADLAAYRQTVAAEEKRYQEAIAAIMAAAE